MQDQVAVADRVASSLYASHGCHCERPRLSGGNRLVLVVIVRAELRYFRDWVVYHHLLGVDEFVIISNECDADGEGEANLKRSIMDVPCAPTFTYVDGFQTRWQGKKLINCASSFQTNAYRQTVSEMRNRTDIDPAKTWLMFSDVDEYLVVHGQSRGSKAPPVDAIFEVGAPNASMWTVPQVLYGSSYRDDPPVGFVPANFALAAAARCPFCDHSERRELAQHREHKSMCRLSDMFAAAEPKQLFPRDGGRWVHECLASERGMPLPSEKVRDVRSTNLDRTSVLSHWLAAHVSPDTSR